MRHTFAQRLVAEFIGTALLLATVIGSGIMADSLAGGNKAIALLGNTIPTGAILVVLITMLGPISGAHFNPAVSIVSIPAGTLRLDDAAAYVASQVAGATAGVMVAHAMFDLPLLQSAQTVRAGFPQALSEGVATFGLILTILMTSQYRPAAVAMSVGLFITAAYWFTASTSFANPAVTLARTMSDTFSGVRLADVPHFVVAQLIGASAAYLLVCLLSPSSKGRCGQ